MVQKPQYYKLIGRLPVPIKSIYLYDKHNRPIGIDLDPIVQKDFTDAFKNRIVARTKIGPMDVSTVFLTLDHAYSPDPDALPILFETMIFGDNEDAYQERYSTWDEAEKGHAKAVEYAEALLAKAQTIL